MSVIAGKTVLVTGANRGIGKAFSEAFLKGGVAKLYAAVRNLDSAKPLVDEFGDKVVPIKIDVSDPASITEAAKTASDVDIVVNNAGVLTNASPLADDAVENLEFEMKVNVYGLIRMAQAFAPVLKSNGGGYFAQLNSVASVKNFADFATYSASKAASYSITQALREKLEEQGTTVISVHPGPINTDMAHGAGLSEIAEPPSLVADALIDAIENKKFHVFPDTMAKQVGGAYESFATNIVEANLME